MSRYPSIVRPDHGRARRRSRRARHVFRRGFTLIETMLVLAMMGVLAMIVVPRIDTAAWRLRSAVVEVSGLMRSARQKAIRQQHDVILEFEPETSSIRIHENTDSDPAGVVGDSEREHRRPLPEAIDYFEGGPALNGRKGHPGSFEDSRIVFHPNGAVSESGVLYLAPVNSEELPAVRALWIDRASGGVRVYRFDGSQWTEM